MRQLLLLATALVGMLGADHAAAQRGGDRGFDVECPAQRIETGLSVELPRGWRAPADGGRLVDTRVRTQNGRPVLECGYALFGTTIWMRADQPDEAEACAARRKGFVCERKRRGGRSVENSFSLTGDASYDLDQGLRGEGRADVYLQRRGSLKRALAPTPDARIALIGRRGDFELRDCNRARYGSGRIDVDVLQPGTKVCVKTSEGRDALLTVSGLRSRLFGRSTVSFDYEIERRR